MKLYVSSLRQGSGATLLIQVRRQQTRCLLGCHLIATFGDVGWRILPEGHSKKCLGDHQTPPCAVLCIVLTSAEAKEKVCHEQQLSALSTLVWF